MMTWDGALEERLRRLYATPHPAHPDEQDHLPALSVASAGNGFVTALGGKTILTAPARALRVADELPETMRQHWAAQAGAANPHYAWIQGRYVEADRANLNGHLWTTADLKVGSSTVRNGPLNWAHEARRVIGTIADNTLVTPAPALASAGYTTSPVSTTWNAIGTQLTPTLIPSQQERPYIAVVAALWPWVAPGETKAVSIASDAGHLWLSMECLAREIACASDGDRIGCGASFGYEQAVTKPDTMCEHLRTGTSAQRLVDPFFMGGAVVVPPRRPGWSGAHAEIMRQAAALAEQVAPADAVTSEWEHLMAAVLAYAAS